MAVETPVYTLQRSRRRTMVIQVQDGRVDVRAPLRVAQRDVDAFVRKKAGWIERKLAECHERSIEQSSVVDGAAVDVAGETLTVRWRPAVRGEVQRAGGILWIRGRALDQEKARQLFLRWLAAEAQAILLPQAERRIARMELLHKLDGFTLRYTRSLWGRCSGRGNILFNPLILLAPPAVMDYLVVHEAAHLRHMNHSREFWSLVAQHCEHWQQSRRWLKEHGHRLRVG